MSSTALVPTNGAAAAQLAFELGAVWSPVSLDVREGVDLTQEGWENIGRCIGFVGRAWRWWVADWIRKGEEAFGDAAAQGIDDKQSRYDVARRITGLDQGTLQNMNSIGSKIPKERRREELDFHVHAPVMSLEPDEQVVWLQRAIDNSWGRSELRDAIRAAKAGSDGDGDGDTGAPGGSMSVAERIEAAARLVAQQAQPRRDGQYLVPAEPMKQLLALVGSGE